MSFHTPWKTLLLILLPGLLILADDPNSISLLQFQEEDPLAGFSIALSGETDGNLPTSSWTPDESENLYLANSEAEGVPCAGSPSQNQGQQPANSSKRRKIKRSDHRKRDGANPPDFCRADAIRKTRSGEAGQQVEEGQKITPGTELQEFPLPDSPFFKIRQYNYIYVCHLVSFAGSLQTSTPVTWLEPCRRWSTTGSCTAQEDLWLCTYVLDRVPDGNPALAGYPLKGYGCYFRLSVQG